MFQWQNLTHGKFSSIINLKKVNDIRYINKFFETVKKATNIEIKAPQHLFNVLDKKERFDIIENNISKIKNYIIEKTI